MRLAVAASVCMCALAAGAGASDGRDLGAPSQTIVFGQSYGDEPGIYSVRSDGMMLRRLTAGPDGAPVLSPDGRMIAFTRSRVIGTDDRGDDITTLDLYVMRLDGSARTRVARVAHQPDWSPDGRRLAFARFFGSAMTLWTSNADGTGARRIAKAGNGAQPDWSPDGNRIAFERWTGDISELFVVNANGTGERRLLRRARIEGQAPAWSPDGRRIAFFGAWEDHVYAVSASGTALTPLAQFIGETGDPPAWSPSGELIAFARYRDTINSPNNEYIHVVRPTGTGPKLRLAGPNAWNPQWSSDGRRIAFVQGHRTIKVMNADGSSVRTVVRLKGFVGGFDW